MSCHVGVLILPGCVASSALGLMDILASANRIARTVNNRRESPFHTQLLSLDGQAVRCGQHYQLTVEQPLNSARGLDILFIPSFPIGSAKEIPELLASQTAIIAWLQENQSHVPRIASHCSGNLLLAEAGLLDGHRATSSWWLTGYFQDSYPDCQVDTSSITVESGRYVTGGSTSAFLDLALWLIEREGGEHLARLVAKYWMLDNQRLSQAPYQLLGVSEHPDSLISLAEQWLRKNLGNPISMSDLANHLGISPRTMIRRFQATLGKSPQTHLQHLRIERSKILLETTNLPLTEISRRCGYSDESAFRRLFGRYCELSPREYRRRFNTRRAPAAQEMLEKADGKVSQK